MTAVQEVTRSKPLPTPAPTPCNSNTPSEQAPTLLPSQHITREEPGCYDRADTPLASQHVTREGEFDCEDPVNRHNVSGGYYDESSLADQQGLEQGSRRSQYTYIEVADDSESEQSDSSQHSASLDGQHSADHGDDLHDQDARPNGQSSWGRSFDIGPFLAIAPPPLASTNQLHLDVELTPTRLTS